MRRAPSLIAMATLVALFLALPGATVAVPPSAATARPPARMSPASWTKMRALAGNIGALSAAVDGAGHLHIAASAATGITYVTDASGAWAAKLVLSNSAGTPALAPADTGTHDTWDVPSIALDDAGHVFIAAAYGCFLCAPGDTAGIWYITDKGHAAGAFGAPRKLAATDATDPSLKLHDGHLYLAYGTVGRPGPGHTPVYLKTNVTGAWTRDRIAIDGYDSSLRVDSAGHARVAFAGLDDVRYTRATTLTGGFVTKVIPGSAGRNEGTWHTETIATGAEPFVGGVVVRATPMGLFVVYGRTTDVRGVWVARS